MLIRIPLVPSIVNPSRAFSYTFNFLSAICAPLSGWQCIWSKLSRLSVLILPNHCKLSMSKIVSNNFADSPATVFLNLHKYFCPTSYLSRDLYISLVTSLPIWFESTFQKNKQCSFPWYSSSYPATSLWLLAWHYPFWWRKEDEHVTSRPYRTEVFLAGKEEKWSLNPNAYLKVKVKFFESQILT